MRCSKRPVLWVTNTSRGLGHPGVGHAPHLGAKTLNLAGQPALGRLVPMCPLSAVPHLGTHQIPVCGCVLISSCVSPGPPWSHRPDRTPRGAGGEGRPRSPWPPGLHRAERRNCECGGLQNGGPCGGNEDRVVVGRGPHRWAGGQGTTWGGWVWEWGVLQGAGGGGNGAVAVSSHWFLLFSCHVGDPWCYWTHRPRWPPWTSCECPPRAALSKP